MKRIAIILSTAAVLMATGILLRASSLQVPSGTWIAAGTMTSAGSGASSVLLPDGRILIAGGDDASGPTNSSELFSASGSFSLAAPMNVPRSGHVAVVLQDGRVLVAGGTSSGGTATNTAEIYDPAGNTWTNVTGGMVEARTGQTAVLLHDGRVVIAGGQNGSRISSTIEVFDPSVGRFAAVGIMSSPRTQHAMAVLADGRVLIVGGNNGTGPVGSTDIFDPNAGTVSAGPKLSVARFGHTATTLLNGEVVVIGGNNGNANVSQMDVTPGELLDPTAATPAFVTLGSNLATPREGHLAFLLPNNNNVLIVGGTSGRTTVASAELFKPKESSEGVWTYAFGPTGSMGTARSSATGAANQMSSPTSVRQMDGVLLVAGGKGANGKPLNSSEAYGFATVQTDQGDYPPGTQVTITGSGWQPGETVKLQLVESPLIDTHGPYTVTADGNGNITDRSFTTDAHDADVKFTLMAVGSVSQAQMTFTDSPNFVIAGSVNDDITGTGLSGVTLNFYQSGSSSCTSPTAWTVPSTTTLSSGAYNVTGARNVHTVCVVLTVPANYTASGAVAGTASTVISNTEISTPDGNSGGTSTGNKFFVHNTGAVETIVASTVTAKYSASAQNVALKAAVTSTDGTVNTGTVTFTIMDGATTIGTATSGSVASGSASVSYALPAHTTAKSYTIQAVYKTGSGTSDVTDSSHQLTVNAASLTVTGITVNSKTYDGTTAATLNTGSATLVGVGSGDTVTLVTSGYNANYSDANVANSKSVTVSGMTLSGASAGNYTLTQPTGLTGNITAKTLTSTGLTVPPSKAYDGTTAAIVSGTAVLQAAEAIGTGTATDGKPYSVDSVTITGTATGTYNTKNVTTATTVTFGGQALAGTGHGNYTLSVSTQAATITTAALTVTANGDSKVYGQAKSYGAGSTAFTSSGLQSSETIGSVTLTVSGNGGAATAPVSGSPYTMTPSAATGGTFTASNYTITYVPGALTVSPATLTYTATPTSRSYGTANPVFTGTVTGFLGTDTQANATTGTLTFTSPATTTSSVGSYPINGSGLTAINGNYTFVQAPGNATALTITQTGTLTYTANPVSRSYGTANPAFTGTVTGFIGSDTQANSTTGTLTFTSPATSTSGVGSYAINGSGLTANNGKYTFVQAASNATALTITPATPIVTVTGGTFAYDGNPHGATATAVGVDGITPVTGSFTFIYTPPGNSTVPVNAGTYSVTANFTSSDPNYTSASGLGSITITSSTSSTVTLNNTNTLVAAFGKSSLSTAMSVTAGGSNTVAFATVWVDEGSGASGTTFNVAATYGGQAMTSAGPTSYDYDYAPISSQVFYLVNPPTGTNTLVVNATASSGTIQEVVANLISYNGVNQTTPVRPGTYQTLSSTNGTSVGSFTATISSNTSDLALGTVEATYTFASPASNQTLDGVGSADYKVGSDHATVGGSSISDTWSFTNPYAFYAYVGFSIQAASGGGTPTLTYTANPVSRSYGTANPAFTGTVTGFIGSDTQANSTTGTLTFTSPATSTSGVGSYAINGSGLTANGGKYTFVQAASNATALTITKATPTITVSGGTFTYDGNPHGATATAVGVDGHTAVTGSFSFIYTPPGNSTVPVNVGTYSVTANFTSSDPNYNNASGSASITITSSSSVPVTLNNANTPVAAFGKSSLSAAMSVTAGGSNTVAFATVWVDEGSGASGTTFNVTATYGGQAMTSAGATSYDYNYAPISSQVFYLVNPPTGTNTLVVNATASSGTIQEVVANLISYNGVSQTTPVRPGTYQTLHSATGVTVGSLTARIASNASDLTLGTLEATYTFASPASNQTVDGSASDYFKVGSDHSTTGAASVADTWSFTNPWAYIAYVGFSIEAANGSSGTGPNCTSSGTPVYDQYVLNDISNTPSAQFGTTTTCDLMLVYGATQLNTAIFSTPPAFSDGTTMTQCSGCSVTTSTNSMNVRLWTGFSPGSTQPTFTINANTVPPQTLGGIGFELTGVTTLDQFASNQFVSDTTTTRSSPTITTQYPNEILLCLASEANPISGGAHFSNTPASGWTLIEYGNQQITYKLAPTAGQYSCSATRASGTEDVIISIATFH